MTRRKALGFSLGASVLTVAALASVHRLAAPLVLENVTRSLPTGLYHNVAGRPAPGAVVAVRQPAVARAYLRALGFPAEALLLKRVVATSGTVCATAHGVVADSRVFVRRKRDRLGSFLPQWEGCRRLDGEAFLAGDDARSFDSRYFGPVRIRSIVGVYERLQ